MNRRQVILSASAAAATACLWLSMSHTEPAMPTVKWRIGDDLRTAIPYQEVAAEEPLRLTVASRAPLFVYVASRDQEDGTLTWFPSPMLKSDVPEPLPAGRTTLPGCRDGAERAWPARPGLAVTTWVAIASRTELPDLAAVLASLRQISNSTFTDGSMVISNPRDGTAPRGRPGQPPPHPLLAEAFAQLPQPDPNGPMQPAGTSGIWFAVLTTVAKKNAQGEKATLSPLDKLKPLQAPGTPK
jgi:hypothetical protein